jgi:hypothetical protein
MPDSPGEGQPVKVVRNGAGGTKRVWKLATRNQAPSGRAPRPSSSEERRGRSSGLRCRPHRASAHRGWPGSRRTADGWSPMVRTRIETRWWNGVVAPFGEQPHRVARRSRGGTASRLDGGPEWSRPSGSSRSGLPEGPEEDPYRDSMTERSGRTLRGATAPDRQKVPRRTGRDGAT